MNSVLKRLQAWPSHVAAGPFLYFSGQMGWSADRKRLCASFDDALGAGPGAESGFAWVNRMEGAVGGQATAIYETYKRLLADGGGLGNLVRFHLYQRDKRFFPVFDRVRRHYEPSAPTPSTAVGMGRFEPDDAARFCIDAIAWRAEAARRHGERKRLSGAGEHASAAHFSHVVGAGPYLFIAGQIPVDTARPGAPLIRSYDDIPEAGRFLQVKRSHEDARNGPIAAQTWFTYDLIRKHLEGVGASMEQVLNLTVYLQDMRDFATFHRVHERFFPRNPPALTVIEAGEVGHKGTLIEIEPTALALRPGFQRRIHGAFAAGAPMQMSVGVEAGGVLFLSGIMGLDIDGAPIENRAGLAPQLRKSALATRLARDPAGLQAMAIVDELRRRLDGKLGQVCQVSLFLQDIADFAAIDLILRSAFGKRLPALMVCEAPRVGPVSGTRVSLTAIAWQG